jgi:hypothetical protein
MRAVVVYESLWGNTAAIAHSIAEGLGQGTPVLRTDQATAAVVADADLIVVGAPVLGFSLPTEDMLRSIGSNPGSAPTPPDLSHPSLRSWLDSLPAGHGRSASFETRIRGPFPGGSVKTITERLEAAGYPAITRGTPFFVKGKYGPMRGGEIERAREWGAELAKLAE